MKIDFETCNHVWTRYQYVRDQGHIDFLNKADQCMKFFSGVQWEQSDLALLRAQRRPALTINKIISTISNVMGEQIFQRNDIIYRPFNSGATEEIADVLTKVFMQISDANQLPWVRSDVFADGIITGRGFYDVRLDFKDSLQGEVSVSRLNPKAVLIDPDAEEYDPKSWGDVTVSRFNSADDIELLYGKDAAEYLRGRMNSYFPYAFDALDYERDRFGLPRNSGYWQGTESAKNMARNIRVLERQWFKLDNLEHFIDIKSGATRPIPEGWDRDRISEYLQKNPDATVKKKMAKRVRWTVIADNLVLHDEWSPYDHFTVVPFFPHFVGGRTVGLVENLLGPQNYLNKLRSQELQVVNTSANSGWMVKTGALTNMSVAELEEQGASTGLVLEVNDMDGIEKIQPNQVPTGLDRLSFKAEEDIKNISGVSDYMQGQAREDVSAKAVKANQQAGSTGLAKIMDSLRRTDHMLAVRILGCVQQYYTEERTMFIVTDKITGQSEPLTVNQVTPEETIANDLTLGEYSVVVTSQPERDTLEDSQFDQLVSMQKDLGIAIPPKYLIQASRLKDKAQIIADLEAGQNSPEAQEKAELGMRNLRAQVSTQEAEAKVKAADSDLRVAKTHRELAQARAVDAEAGNQPDALTEQQMEMHKMEKEHALKREQMEQDFALEKEKMEREFALKREAQAQDIDLKRKAQQDDHLIKKTTAAMQAQAVQDSAAKAAPTKSDSSNG